ncbi:MAG: two-component system response regulator, partial [Candidatus Thiodiazotropha sp.]
ARPYKDAWPLDEVLELIWNERGRQFDPDVVDAFFRLIEKNSI